MHNMNANTKLIMQPLPELNVPKDPFANFAADVDEELIGKLLDHIKPHSTLAFNSMQPHPAWADVEYLGKLAFIVTTKDSAIPKEAQYAMIGATQQPWITKEMDCSHCAPFLGKADDCILLLRGLIEKFMQ